jgi:hypothetical protein
MVVDEVLPAFSGEQVIAAANGMLAGGTIHMYVASCHLWL